MSSNPSNKTTIGRIEPKTIAVPEEDADADSFAEDGFETVSDANTETTEETQTLPVPAPPSTMAESQGEQPIRCSDCGHKSEANDYTFELLDNMAEDWGVLLCPDCGGCYEPFKAVWHK